MLPPAALAEDGERRLVLDGVYAFGRPLDATMRQLIATDQVFYLDSLSKGWLHELVFGMALVPERDRESLQDVFRTLQPSQRQLFVARELMTRFHDFPARLANELAQRRALLAQRLAEAGVTSRPVAQGYLVVIEAEARALLAKHRCARAARFDIRQRAPGSLDRQRTSRPRSRLCHDPARR